MQELDPTFADKTPEGRQMPHEAANTNVADDADRLRRERLSPNDFEIGVEEFAQFPIESLLKISPMRRDYDRLPSKLMKMLRP